MGILSGKGDRPDRVVLAVPDLGLQGTQTQINWFIWVWVYEGPVGGDLGPWWVPYCPFVGHQWPSPLDRQFKSDVAM